MSQVGFKERSAKAKTESKHLKSVKRFIARTQAKVDAKLTQSRLLPTLSPAKRENDQFHPSLDLSLSREEGTSSNVISDDEQPEDVAKELFPLAETTAHTAKGKGAQNHNIKSKRPHRQPPPRRCRTPCPKAHTRTPTAAIQVMPKS